jgi:hypothetical protein
LEALTSIALVEPKANKGVLEFVNLFTLSPAQIVCCFPLGGDLTRGSDHANDNGGFCQKRSQFAGPKIEIEKRVRRLQRDTPSRKGSRPPFSVCAVLKKTHPLILS